MELPPSTSICERCERTDDVDRADAFSVDMNDDDVDMANDGT